MTEHTRTPEGLSSKPRIRPAETGDTRPLSVSARLGRLQFHHSGKFRVLQVADIQDGPKVAKDTIRLIEASLDAVRPDLVVFTGNQIAGYDPAFAETFRKRRWSAPADAADTASDVSDTAVTAAAVSGTAATDTSDTAVTATDATADVSDTTASTASDTEAATVAAAAHERTRESVRGAIAQFLAPLIERRVPFAVTYGNHDFQCGLSNDELDAIYREFPGCVNPMPGVEADVLSAHSLLPDQVVYPHAAGTFALPVADEAHKRTVLGIVVLDSGDYAHGGGFAAPADDALAFLARVPAMIGARSALFQHMPLPEYYDLLTPVTATTPYAMQGYRDHAAQYYVLDEAKVRPGGYLGEGISCPDASREFAVLRGDDAAIRAVTDAADAAGVIDDDDAVDTRAGMFPYIGVATGHDHRNWFVGELDGVLLAATPTCGFGSYGPAPAKRATRLIEFDIRHPHEPRTQLLEFGELVGKPSSKKAYTYALNAKPPQDGEGDDLLRRPTLWGQIKGLFA
ncbi:serine/threonine protein phosphatase [Bifidobacterium stellenboschense]|uniref:Ser/threonine protein phosphatase n=1 Tax=Bifidobacterium stellenboschense TaxID=762211 RepID=A0A087DRC0_9BIFI|nr:serine/threonine protein phosphatase [Bifidobacterium stellenboschense]KFI98070.1 ser/threonine protein phosphatase [Bifidobacterium stellenboschense]